MADDNASGPFFDAFAQFGRNLRLPQVTISDVVEHHSRNIAAMQKAASNTTEAGQAIMAQQREALENTLSDIRDMVDNAREGGLDRENARGIVADNMEFAKRSFEATISNATSTTEIVRDTSKANFDILKDRVQESIEEIKSTMDKPEAE